jgi:hypothetical protein
MDEVQKTSSFNCSVPSSESFWINMNLPLTLNSAYIIYKDHTDYIWLPTITQTPLHYIPLWWYMSWTYDRFRNLPLAILPLYYL